MLSIGLLANGHYGAGWNLTTEGSAATNGVTGIFYGLDPGLGQLGAQVAGVLTLCIVMFGIVLAFFKIQNAVM